MKFMKRARSRIRPPGILDMSCHCTVSALHITSAVENLPVRLADQRIILNSLTSSVRLEANAKVGCVIESASNGSTPP